MGATSATVTILEQDMGASQESNNPFEVKEIIAQLTDVADDGDTFTVTLANYGITTLWYVKGYTHTTEGSLIIEEAPTTSVSSGVLTVTIGGSTDNKARSFLIGGV